ncbi:hypothetical protein [Paenibacillus sp. ACRRX]|nr:hypothetical protein [Paenibacillus sp. ACRRX]
MWLRSGRTSVGGYYPKLGLSAHGDSFDLSPIGPHTDMYKNLSKD